MSADVASEAIRAALLRATAAVGTEWTIQYAQLDMSPESPDGLSDPSARYIVVRPFGGRPRSHLRNPILSVVFIGGEGERPAACSAAVQRFIEEMRDGVNPTIMYAEVSDPVASQSSERRPIFEVAVQVTVSL